jgi:hypothetical protein
MLKTHLINASAESGSTQGEAFQGSFQRDAHSGQLSAGSSVTRQTISRFSSAGFSAPAVSPQTTFVLCSDSSVAAVRGNYFDAVMSELGVKLV